MSFDGMEVGMLDLIFQKLAEINYVLCLIINVNYGDSVIS